MYHHYKSYKKVTALVMFILHGMLTYSQTGANNYIRVRVARTKIPTTAGMDGLMATKDSVSVTYQYIDGLGRPLQTVQRQGSPAGNDIIQPFVYDQFSRDSVKYLPYTINSATPGAYQPNAITGTGGYTGSAQYQFYQQAGSGHVNTPYPAAATNYDLSPLNRTVEQGAAGASWQLANSGVSGSGHTVKMDYASNNQSAFSPTPVTNNPGSRLVVLYNATIKSDQSRTLARASAYATGELTLTIRKDENWNPTTDGCLGTTEEYKDLENHVVLKRTYNQKGSALEMLSTYYVYDDFGNLAFVLPPGAKPDSAYTIPQSTLDNLCYQYRYDERGRLTQKKLPGKGWEYTVYNTVDQPVATQDSLQRAANQWIFTKYDGAGRIIMTGIWTNGGTAITRSALQATLNSVTTLWETPVNTGNGYTAVAWPTSSVTSLTINYYDGYSGIPGLPAAYTAPAGTSTQTRGLLTATLTAVLNTINNTTPDMLWTVHYYDDLGRLTTSYAQHYLGGTVNSGNYDVVNNTYNFTNAVTASVRQHYNTTGTNPVVTINNTYVYDHLGRKTQTLEQINGGSLVTLSQNDYNELGQLYVKHLHGGSSSQGANITLGSADALSSGQQRTVQASSSIIMQPGFIAASGSTFLATISASSSLQDITYAYNERGWLLSSSAPLFAMQLNYNTGAAPQYNGNIVSQQWGTPGSLTNSFAYSYDRLNRLTSGISGDNKYIERNISYDELGNINTLSRVYNNILIDSLAYSYNNTNQVQSISDRAADNSIMGYKAGSYIYAYDGNGNMIADSSKSITISYNLLNLPQSIPAKNTTYVYDATGQKLRRVTGTQATDYVAGIEYDGGTITFIQTEEGRALYNGGTYNYEYNLTDHLGDTRLTFDSSTGIARQEQQDDYMPFGMEISRGTIGSPKNEYLYNKKELQENLQLYDYGARFYDPVIGRWTAVDPLAEKGRRWSSYSYVFDNPLRYIDPDGMWGDFYDQQGNKVGTDGKKDGRNYVITDKDKVKAAKKATAKGLKFSKSDVKAYVELPSAHVRERMGEAVDRSNNPSDEADIADKKGGMHEEGGYYGTNKNGQEVVIDAKPGNAYEEGKSGIGVNPTARGDQYSDQTSWRDKDNIEGTFHVHPVGGFVQPPSTADLNNSVSRQEQLGISGNNYVLGAGNNTVYIYKDVNGKGKVIATFPLDKFRRVK